MVEAAAAVTRPAPAAPAAPPPCPLPPRRMQIRVSRGVARCVGGRGGGGCLGGPMLGIGDDSIMMARRRRADAFVRSSADVAQHWIGAEHLHVFPLGAVLSAYARARRLATDGESTGGGRRLGAHVRRAMFILARRADPVEHNAENALAEAIICLPPSQTAAAMALGTARRRRRFKG